MGNRWASLACVLGMVGLIGSTLVIWPAFYVNTVGLPKLAILVLTMVPAWLISRVPGSSRARQAVRTEAMIGVYLFVVALECAFAPSWRLAVWGLSGRQIGGLQSLALAATMLVAMRCATEIVMSRFLGTLVAVGAISVVYGLFQAAHLDFVSWRGGGAMISTLANPDHASAWFAIVAVVAVHLAIDRTRSALARWAGTVISSLAAYLVFRLFRTGVEQGVLLGVVGMTITAWLALRSRTRMRPWANWMILGSGVIALVVLASYMHASNGVVHRLLMYKTGFAIARDHPWIGIGFGRLLNVYRQYRTPVEARLYGVDAQVDDIHSDPLQVLVTGGVVLLIPYVLIGVTVIRAIAACWGTKPCGAGRDANAIGIVAVLWMMQAAFGPTLSALAAWGWAAAGLVLGHATLRQSADPGCSHDDSRGGTPQPVGQERRRRTTILLGAAVASVIVLLVGVRAQWRAERTLDDMRVWIAGGQRPSATGWSQMRDRLMRDSVRREALAVSALRLGDPVATEVVFRMFATQGDTLGIATLAFQQMAVDSRTSLFQTFEAEARRSRGDWSGVSELLGRAARSEPTTPRLWLQWADAAVHAGDTATAMLAARRGQAMADTIQDSTDAYRQALAGLRATLPSIVP